MHKTKYSIFNILLILFLFAGLSSAQTLHQIVAGENTLNDALLIANDGDVIELTDGGQLYSYSLSDKMYITKKITIKAADGLAAKPIIRVTTPGASSPRIFEIKAGGELRLKGLDLDCSDGNGQPFAKQAIRSEDVADTSGAFNFKLFIDDCYIHDSKESLIKGHRFTIGDSLVFTNTIFANALNEGILMRESTTNRGPDLKYLEMTNCTFYHIGRNALYTDFSDPVVRINHCTFDDIAWREDKEGIYTVKVNDVQIKNSIISNHHTVSRPSIKIYGNSSISYTDTFNVGYFSLNDNASVGSGMLGVDPMYKDAANLDFSLPENSSLLSAGDDGKALGDLRWAPKPVEPETFKVFAGENTLNDAIQSAKDGDVIELVDGGQLYSYSIDDKMVITKKLTIKATDGIASKPIIRVTTPGAGSPRIFEIRAGGELRLKGLDLDCSDGNGQPFAKQAVRSEDVADTSGAFNFKLFIDDCYIHDSKESLIKGHRFTTGDSLVFKNTIFANAQNEGILMRESTSNRGPNLKYVELTNCTFTHIGRNAIYTDFSDPVVRINHCTFDDIAWREDKEGIYTVKVKDVQIKNSIISNHHGATRPSIKIYGNSSIAYTDTFNVGYFSLNDNASVGSGMLGVDPMYKDAANQDYTLLGASLVRGMGDDGMAMGDLRWAIDPNSKVVSVSVVGEGTVTLSPAGGIYPPGTEVTLTAIPATGWVLESWTGVAVFPPNQNPIKVTVNDNMSITATFKDLVPRYTLKVDSLGLGGVVVAPLPDENKQYKAGTLVTLTAVPVQNWEFVEWLGDITGNVNPVTFAVDSNMTVTASFRSTFPQVKLILQIEGRGDVSVDPKPILGSYDVNTQVTITATPVAGWKFLNYSGHVSGTNNVATLKLDANKLVTAKFGEEAVAGGILEIDSNWDLKEALDYANNNSNVSKILLTTSGVYTSKSEETVSILKPLVIEAKQGLSEKPVITNSDPTLGELDVFRVYDDLTIKGVVLDGGHELSHGMKYGIRLSNSTSINVKQGSNITVENCDFINFFDKKNPSSDGHAFKIDVNVKAGDVKFENCLFNGFGYEAIRISDTEKWPTDGALNSFTLRNCTFTNVDAECVRYYSDLVETTPDAPVLIEHVTINNSATRVFYLKNSGGAIVRDVIISNPRQSGHGRDGDLMDCQGSGEFLSFVSDITLFNTGEVALLSTDGVIDETTIWNIDPKYKDAANNDYTLTAESHLYGLGHDGSAIGDLRWATNTPTHVSLAVTVSGNGLVNQSPDPVGKTYDPGQVVTLSAVPDTGYVFVGWTGDASGTDATIQVTLDASKNVTATFDIDTGVDALGVPTEYNMAQNYPNPFNPSTTIRFGLPVGAKVTLTVFNVLGQQVATLIDNQNMSAGYHETLWNSKNEIGANLSSGLYIYKLHASGQDGKDFVQTMKMMYLK